MELLSLPDEMCANVMKFLPFEMIQEVRRVSTRLDRISKQFRLNRFEVRTIYLCPDRFCPSLSDLEKERAERRKSWEKETDPFTKKDFWEKLVREDEQKQLMEGVDYNICRVSVVLKSGNIEADYKVDYQSCYRRTLIKPCEQKKEKFTVLDDILSRLSFTDYLCVFGGEYDIELDKCLRRNRKLFRNARFASLTQLTINCAKEEFTLFKNYKNLQYVYCQIKKSNTNFAIEELLADHDAGITLIQKQIGNANNRGPHRFGDKLLHQWIERSPTNAD